jgi:hypothetical protein
MPLTEDDLNERLDRKAAAKFLQMSVTSFDRLVAAEAIEVFRPSGRARGRVFTTKRACLDYLNRQRTPARKTRPA